MTFEVVYNTALKIYSKLYVGVKLQGEDKALLAFATPYTEDAAGRKRQDTVKNWVGSSTYDYKTRKHIPFEPDLRVVDNVAMAGFKITDDIKRVYYGGGNVVWRLEHPLGWEIEIQSNNLMALIQGVGIEPGGVVPGECVLARDGANNVLLPVSSQEYKDAIKAAEGAKTPNKVPMKDRVIGRFYRLASGEYGQYMGKMYIRTGEDEYHSRNYDSYLSFMDQGKRYQVKAECRNQIIHNNVPMELYEIVYVPEHEIGNEVYKYKVGGASKLYKSAPLVSELDQGSCTKEEAETIVNANSMSWAGSSKSMNPIHASLIDECNVQFTTVQAPQAAYDTVREDVLDKAKVSQSCYEHQLDNPQYSQHAKAPKFTIAHLLRNHHGRMEYQAADGSIYTSIDAIDMKRRYGSWRLSSQEDKALDQRVLAIAGRCIISPHRLQRITIQGYGYDSIQEDTREQWHLGLVAKQYDTVDELMAVCDNLFAEGRLVQIKTERKS